MAPVEPLDPAIDHLASQRTANHACVDELWAVPDGVDTSSDQGNRWIWPIAETRFGSLASISSSVTAARSLLRRYEALQLFVEVLHDDKLPRQGVRRVHRLDDQEPLTVRRDVVVPTNQ